ncbi:MAG: hypothetical protein KBS97_02565 [Firmicutes bacterium]|nr:hypothetical protein [Candidatus Fiminaster equi]
MKNRIMGILALASCVVLSGCGDKEEAKIVISELPTNLVEGNQIDLKDYITVSGGTGGYSINFDDDSFAKITQESETLITLNEMGNVSFTVDYSGKTQEGTLVVGSKMLNDFVSNVENVGYDYHNLYFEYDDDMNEIGLHWENYGEKLYIDKYMDFESEEYDYIGGYAKAGDGIIYSFNEIHDGDEVDFDFTLTGNEPLEMSEYSMQLNTIFPTSGYTVKKEVNEETGESYSYLRLDENENGDVKRVFENFFGLNTKAIEQYGYEISGLEIVEDALVFDEELSLNVYVVYGMGNVEGEEGLLWDGFLSFDKDVFIKGNIQKYVDDEEIPESKYTLNIDAIEEAVQKHNYQIDYTYNWYNATVSSDGTKLIRGDALNRNPYVDPAEMEESGHYLYEFFNAFGGFSAYVQSDKIFVDVPNGTKYGLIEQSNVAWDYAYKTDKYVATENLGRGMFSRQVNEKMYNFEFLSGIGLGDEEISVYDGMFINTKEKVSENEYKYTLSGLTAESLFTALFIESIFDGEYDPEDDIRSHYNTIDVVAILMYEYEINQILDVEITEKYNGSELTELIFDFAFIYYIEPETPYDDYKYVEYVMSANVKFGQCDMPEFDVEFPAAE